jgi:hypothetical protein
MNFKVNNIIKMKVELLEGGKRINRSQSILDENGKIEEGIMWKRKKSEVRTRRFIWKKVDDEKNNLYNKNK